MSQAPSAATGQQVVGDRGEVGDRRGDRIAARAARLDGTTAAHGANGDSRSGSVRRLPVRKRRPERPRRPASVPAASASGVVDVRRQRVGDHGVGLGGLGSLRRLLVSGTHHVGKPHSPCSSCRPGFPDGANGMTLCIGAGPRPTLTGYAAWAPIDASRGGPRHASSPGTTAPATLAASSARRSATSVVGVATPCERRGGPLVERPALRREGDDAAGRERGPVRRVDRDEVALGLGVPGDEPGDARSEQRPAPRRRRSGRGDRGRRERARCRCRARARRPGARHRRARPRAGAARTGARARAGRRLLRRRAPTLAASRSSSASSVSIGSPRRSDRGRAHSPGSGGGGRYRTRVISLPPLGLEHPRAALRAARIGPEVDAARREVLEHRRDDVAVAAEQRAGAHVLADDREHGVEVAALGRARRRARSRAAARRRSARRSRCSGRTGC